MITCFTGDEPFYTNAYIVTDEASKQCALFDAPHGTMSAISNHIKDNGLKLSAIYLTHSHYDHFGDLAALKKMFDVEVFVHAADRQNLIEPGSDHLPIILPTPKAIPDKELKEGQELNIGAISFKVLETPGHSPGSVTFWFPKEKYVINGDLIFQGGRGRTDFPGCDEEALYRSMKKVFDLGDDVVIYSGHGDKTTVKDERNQL